MTGYLPGDPRYGLSGEALRNYYRTKLAQWAIYCWDKPGMAETRRALVQDQKSYVKNFGERVIGYGHFVSDDGRDTLGTSFFMQLDDRAAADAFVAGEPMSKAGRLPARRNSPLVEQLRQARGRLSPQGHAAVPVHGTQDRHARVLPRAPPRARVIFRVVRRQLHLRGPIRSADGADNIGTALLLELPDRAAADKFWNEEPFAKNGGYQGDARITRWVFGD
jgi:hypothetical protein